MDYNQLSTQSFLAAVSPCSGELGTIRFDRTPIAQAARGAATSAKGTQSDARNTEPGSRPLSRPLALATNPAIAAPTAIPACGTEAPGADAMISPAPSAPPLTTL